MPGTHEWLFAHPRAIPRDLASYWPDTCFLEVPELPLDSDALAQIEGGEQIGLEAIEEFYALLAHEHTHWIQATACSYGRFQAAIEQCRTEVLESFWGLLDVGQADTMLARRQHGESVFKTDADRRPLPPESIGPVAARLYRHWWALGSLRYQFDRSASHLDALMSSRFRYGLAALYSQVGPEVSRVALLSDDDLRDAAFALAPSVELSSCACAELETAAIAECAAVLNQHWLYAYQAEWSRRHASRTAADRWWSILVESWKGKADTFYGDAFRAFANSNPALDLNEPVPLATLNVICFVALDGPCPGEDGRPTPSWREVVPSLRFQALSEAINHVGTLPAHSVCALAPDQYHDYVARLCDAASLPLPRPYACISPARWPNSPANDLRLLHHDAATEAAALLKNLPGALVAPAEASIYLEEDLLRHVRGAAAIALQAPLLVIGGHSSHVGIDQARFELSATAGLYQRLMFNLFAEIDTPRQSGRPRDERGNELMDFAMRLVERRIGLALTARD